VEKICGKGELTSRVIKEMHLLDIFLVPRYFDRQLKVTPHRPSFEPEIKQCTWFSQGRVKLLSASVKRCSASLKRFKVSLQPATGRGIQRWRLIIGVFCLFCCKIGLIILIDYISFAYLAVLLTKECIIN